VERTPALTQSEPPFLAAQSAVLIASGLGEIEQRLAIPGDGFSIAQRCTDLRGSIARGGREPQGVGSQTVEHALECRGAGFLDSGIS
jgi:hypothetical protein